MLLLSRQGTLEVHEIHRITQSIAQNVREGTGRDTRAVQSSCHWLRTVQGTTSEEHNSDADWITVAVQVQHNCDSTYTLAAVRSTARYTVYPHESTRGTSVLLRFTYQSTERGEWQGEVGKLAGGASVRGMGEKRHTRHKLSTRVPHGPPFRPPHAKYLPHLSIAFFPIPIHRAPSPGEIALSPRPRMSTASIAV
jgi:hypothetical protein